MEKAEIRQAIELAKANYGKLSKCTFHVFVDATPQVQFGKKYRCKRCGGEIDQHAYHWYSVGYKQGMALKQSVETSAAIER